MDEDKKYNRKLEYGLYSLQTMVSYFPFQVHYLTLLEAVIDVFSDHALAGVSLLHIESQLIFF